MQFSFFILNTEMQRVKPVNYQCRQVKAPECRVRTVHGNPPGLLFTPIPYHKGIGSFTQDG